MSRNAILLMIACSIAILNYEQHPDSNILTGNDALWWAIETMTTVGYGDVYPITVGGKIFTFFVLIFGVGIVTVPAALLATALTKAREIEEKEREHHR